jgi:hypothetical protein
MTDPTNQSTPICGHSGHPGAVTDAGFCPGVEQSGEEVSAWLRDHGAPGEAVVVLFRQQGLCQFRLDEIAAWRGHRVHLVEHGSFDSRGFSGDSPKGIYLRILKPTAAVLAAASKGATLQHCKLVNERDLSGREEALAQRMRLKFAPDT